MIQLKKEVAITQNIFIRMADLYAPKQLSDMAMSYVCGCNLGCIQQENNTLTIFDYKKKTQKARMLNTKFLLYQNHTLI